MSCVRLLYFIMQKFVQKQAKNSKEWQRGGMSDQVYNNEQSSKTPKTSAATHQEQW